MLTYKASMGGKGALSDLSSKGKSDVHSAKAGKGDGKNLSYMHGLELNMSEAESGHKIPNMQIHRNSEDSAAEVQNSCESSDQGYPHSGL